MTRLVTTVIVLNMASPINKKLAWIGLVVLLGCVSLFFLQKINLHTADIGRHVMNGRVIMGEGLESEVLSTNYYAETQSDFPFINHHWLYGVWAYWVQANGGWAGLVLTNALLATLAISIMIIFSARQSSPAATIIALFITIPLLTQRTEVRPESWSLLFLSSSFIAIYLWFTGKIQNHFLFIFQILLSAFWVNFHLFFIFNLFLLGCATLAQCSTYLWVKFKHPTQPATNPLTPSSQPATHTRIQTAKSHQTSSLFNQPSIKSTQPPSRSEPSSNQNQSSLHASVFIVLTLLASTLVLLFNPNTLSGVLAPFQIFHNYAYPVAENQTVWFYISHYPSRLHFWYGLSLAVVLITSLLWWWRPRNPQYYQLLSQPLLIFVTLSSLGMIILGLSVVRTLSFLAIIAIPVLAFTIHPFLPKISSLITQLPAMGYAVLSSLVIALLLIALATGIFLPYLPNSGLGLLPDSLTAGEFMRTNAVPGPMFNNYDAGGYLIHQLFTTNPDLKLPSVFVDNRPEAYPSHFILNDLIQAQKTESGWLETLAKYNFQSIFFYRHDATTWGQPFLINRVKDPDWVPIYVDNFAIILVRNNPQNRLLIDQHRLPAEMFVVKDE